jgi:acetyltransferase-like isoleucine patch superfamily enzyme
MARIVLFGTGRGAAVAHRFLSRDTDHEIVAFTVDGSYATERTHRGLPLVPFEEVERHYPPDEFRMLALLGYQNMNGLRETKFAEGKAKGYMFESYVASDIFRVEPIDVGENCFILDNQSISLDVKIGNNVVMWSSNHIGDLTTIEDHAWVSSHVTVAANVHVGARAFLGIGATIANGVSVGPGSFVGADVLLSTDLPEGAVRLAGASEDADLNPRQFMRVMIAGKKL